MDTSKLLLIGYIVGGIIGVVSSHFHRDRHAFAGVNESTLLKLQEYFPEILGKSWREVSPCFYAIIDKDKSLEHKSKGLFFNGFIVTTSYDGMWFSLLACLLGAWSVFKHESWCFLVTAVSAIIISYLVWQAAVRRHVELVSSQVDVIEKRFAAEFRACASGERR